MLVAPSESGGVEIGTNHAFAGRGAFDFRDDGRARCLHGLGKAAQRWRGFGLATQRCQRSLGATGDHLFALVLDDAGKDVAAAHRAPAMRVKSANSANFSLAWPVAMTSCASVTPCVNDGQMPAA